MARAAICILFLALVAAPAQAQTQAPTPACYPPPCPAASPDVLFLDTTSGAPATIVTGARADSASPAPYVGVGLLAVALTFIALASSRRLVGLRQAERLPSAPPRLRWEPDRSLR
ncbi:MAG TPA: hypothetical protein VM942_02365 [Acidimicrobiales bacterium]|nr:hypothetical protein [Acidimicrobiales bacterium]